MTAAEIVALSDRDLDAMVHQKVMGYEGLPNNLPAYSFDPVAMLAVLARIVDLGFTWDIRHWMRAVLVWKAGEEGESYAPFPDVTKLPRAVAEAALLAVGGKS